METISFLLIISLLLQGDCFVLDGSVSPLTESPAISNIEYLTISLYKLVETFSPCFFLNHEGPRLFRRKTVTSTLLSSRSYYRVKHSTNFWWYYTQKYLYCTVPCLDMWEDIVENVARRENPTPQPPFCGLRLSGSSGWSRGSGSLSIHTVQVLIRVCPGGRIYLGSLAYYICPCLQPGQLKIEMIHI